MSEPFLAQIQIVAFNFAPRGWASCNGQILPIAQNQALFALLGTTFGGNGSTTFALPNLQNAAPLDYGQGPGLTPRALGEIGGASTVTLQASQMAAHSHSIQGTTAQATTGTPASSLLLGQANVQTYAQAANVAPMSSSTMAARGGGQPHNNLQPYLGLHFVIALQGIFPSRN